MAGINKGTIRDSAEYRKDVGKPRWELLPLQCLGGMVDVLTFGAGKYDDDNWKRAMDDLNSDMPDRTFGSLMRHLLRIQEDGLSARDSESLLYHIDHLMCNVLFLKYRQLVESRAESMKSLSVTSLGEGQPPLHTALAQVNPHEFREGETLLAYLARTYPKRAI